MTPLSIIHLAFLNPQVDRARDSAHQPVGKWQVTRAGDRTCRADYGGSARLGQER